MDECKPLVPGIVATAAGRKLSSTTYAPLQRALIGIPDGEGDIETIAQVRQHPIFASASTQFAPRMLAQRPKLPTFASVSTQCAPLKLA